MKVKIWICLLLVYLVWGSTYLAIRFAVETIPPFLMAGTRLFSAGLVLYAWRRLAGDPAPSPRQWRGATAVGLLMLVGGNGLLSWAEQRVPSGVAALLIGSVPLWMAAIEALRTGGERPNWIGLTGLLVGFAGIALLVAPSLAGGDRAELNPLGLIPLLVASLSWSIGSVYSRHAQLPRSALLGTGMEMLTGGAGLFVVGTLAGEWGALDLAGVSSRSWLGLVYLIVFGSLIGYTAFTWLLRNAPLPLVSTYAYVNPLIAILLGSLLAGERLTGHILAAGLVIVGSVVAVNLAQRLKRPAPSASPAD